MCRVFREIFDDFMIKCKKKIVQCPVTPVTVLQIFNKTKIMIIILHTKYPFNENLFVIKKLYETGRYHVVDD